jgi:hypothetical protein
LKKRKTVPGPHIVKDSQEFFIYICAGLFDPVAVTSTSPPLVGVSFIDVCGPCMPVGHELGRGLDNLPLFSVQLREKEKHRRRDEFLMLQTYIDRIAFGINHRWR